MQTDTRVDVFEEIFLYFLALGTLVGIVVIAYTLYNAYKYRDSDDREADAGLPSVGELPTGGEGGKKLFVSFGLSAIIVISLVLWTYGMLLYVESPSDGGGPGEDAVEVDVTGSSFSWMFEYDDGETGSNDLVVPADETVWLNVTGREGDVWHTFGISEQRVKADAIPGEYDETWFEADETGEYLIECFELCGPGHSGMEGTLIVVDGDLYDVIEEEEARGDFVSAYDEGEVDLDSDPDEFEAYLEEQEEEEEEEEEDE
ncbi:cytochrome c oxidase subunit II [Natrialbaceae archaeon GCM10025810]|uniref:cytochrome c oxidase subunit II n=1 Tax=Halovalidus salilacus TaxID=3075124 RepID=UPI00361BC722